jgi:hypothetical protein
MPRAQDSERYELTEGEKRDLIKLIEQGKPLPEKYRFLLFADKREVELVWNGKTREVCTAILPFQTLEHIDEPRKESRREIIKVAKNLGVEGALPGMASAGEFLDYEERWTGAYAFENEWQSFRTKAKPGLGINRSRSHVPKARPLRHRRQSDRYFWQRHNDAGPSDCGLSRNHADGRPEKAAFETGFTG